MLLDWLVVLKTLRPMFCRKEGKSVSTRKRVTWKRKKLIYLHLEYLLIIQFFVFR